jgi:hypothetical protein
MSGSRKFSSVVDAYDPQVVERRRPGRIANVSPALIPLLRGDNVPSPDFEEPQEKLMTSARGMVFGTLSSGLLWAILIWVV